MTKERRSLQTFHTSNLKNCLNLRHANVQYMGEWTIKTPNPICRLFFNFTVNRLCGILFNRFYRLEISWLVFLIQLVNYCCPNGRGKYICVLLPLYSTFSLTSSPVPPPSSQRKCTVYTDSVWQGWGGGGLNCTVDHILQEFYSLFLTRFRTYKIVSPPQTKMTSKDDNKGLVSLKFLRPWYSSSPVDGCSRSLSTCHICMDKYRVPVVSTACWHVHCERCWLLCLATKESRDSQWF